MLENEILTNNRRCDLLPKPETIWTKTHVETSVVFLIVVQCGNSISVITKKKVEIKGSFKPLMSAMRVKCSEGYMDA